MREGSVAVVLQTVTSAHFENGYCGALVGIILSDQPLSAGISWHLICDMIWRRLQVGAFRETGARRNGGEMLLLDIMEPVDLRPTRRQHGGELRGELPGLVLARADQPVERAAASSSC